MNNNNNIEVLIKLIVPAVLLIIWALSNLFNRENSASQGRGTPALGPRPGGYPPPDRARERARELERERERQRDQERGVMATPREVGSNRDADVLIIREEPYRPPSAPRPGNQAGNRGQNPPRRNKANRGNPPAPGRRVEADRPRREELHDTKISANVNQSLARPIQLTPLTQGLVTAGDAPQAPAPSTAVERSQSAILLDIRATIASPSRIREALVLNEILQPPVALRKAASRPQAQAKPRPQAPDSPSI